MTQDAWSIWVREGIATAVPGAVQFARKADALGVKIFYLTSRRHQLEQPTRENLKKLGFPLDPVVDTVLTRGEHSDFNSSDKSSRRAYVAKSYRILLLIGDNLEDFVSSVNASVAKRRELVNQYADRWGRVWFVVSNPMYGSWERALTEYRTFSPGEQLKIKREALRSK